MRPGKTDVIRFENKPKKLRLRRFQMPCRNHDREMLFVRGRRHLRSLAQLVSAVLLVLASPTHAETSLVLDCKPDRISGAGDECPVVSVAVSVSGLNWRV